MTTNVACVGGCVLIVRADDVPTKADAVVLRFFYPDSRGVNVFVGGDKKPPMALKLSRMPTKEDDHGAHVVDAQRRML